jgi:hypothetical protein
MTQPEVLRENTDAEIATLREVCLELDELPDQLARHRVLLFLWDRYVAHPIPFIAAESKGEP